MPSGFETWLLYTGLKLHFDLGKYDFFKFKGHVRHITRENFEHRNDRYFFHKLGKLYDDEDTLKFFFAANFYEAEYTWVRDLLGPEAKDIYLNRLGVKENLDNLVMGDINYLFEHDFAGALKVVGGQYPRLLTMAQQGSIQEETLIVLNAAMQFLPIWAEKISDTVLFPSIQHRVIRYAPFLEIDVLKYRKLLREKFTKNT